MKPIFHFGCLWQNSPIHDRSLARNHASGTWHGNHDSISL
jgi:hypothetical protein